MEEHCRDELEDPWSLRHAVVYQRYCFRNGFSTWILFQVPNSIQGQLQHAFSESRSNYPALRTSRPHPVALHALFLVSSQRNWDSYVKYLNKQYSEMVSQPGKSISMFRLIIEDKLGTDLLHRTTLRVSRISVVTIKETMRSTSQTVSYWNLFGQNCGEHS